MNYETLPSRMKNASTPDETEKVTVESKEPETTDLKETDAAEDIKRRRQKAILTIRIPREMFRRVFKQDSKEANRGKSFDSIEDSNKELPSLPIDCAQNDEYYVPIDGESSSDDDKPFDDENSNMNDVEVKLPFVEPNDVKNPILEFGQSLLQDNKDWRMNNTSSSKYDDNCIGIPAIEKTSAQIETPVFDIFKPLPVRPMEPNPETREKCSETDASFFNNVLDGLLDTKAYITVGQLLKLSPKIRKELIKCLTRHYQRSRTKEYVVHSLSCESIVPRVDILINSISLKVLIDGGADCHLMSETTARRCGLPLEVCASVKIQVANGNSTSPIGIARQVPFFVGDHQMEADFFVMPSCGFDVL